jgi:hypothetical protein
VAGRPWFGRRRLGWGLTPVSWQGWALTGAYVILVVVLGFALAETQPWVYATLFAGASAVYAFVVFMTRGS